MANQGPTFWKMEMSVSRKMLEHGTREVSPCACRLCGDAEAIELLHSVGRVPVAGYLEPNEKSARSAPRYELAYTICERCDLVQLAYDDTRDILIDKVYSHYQPTYSMSERVFAYLETFVKKAVEECQLDLGDRVIEIGSNDGTVLELLLRAGMKPVGFEPAAELAHRSELKGFDIIKDYFNATTAARYVEEYGPVKLVVTRHTLEHAFEPLGFLKGIATVLDDDGMAVIEVPYMFLQIVHGHFSSMTHQHVTYFTVSSMAQALQAVGLMIVRVNVANTDGGSMVVYVRKWRVSDPDPNSFIEDFLSLEQRANLGSREGYKQFFNRAHDTCRIIRDNLVDMANRKRLVLGYGAGGKGQTLINMVGLDVQGLPYVIDDTPGKEGQYIPGTGIRVISSNDLDELDPNYILITAPTHLREIVEKERQRIKKTCCFLATTPEFHIVS
jgi:novobiocin biosynthesis protein NovU